MALAATLCAIPCVIVAEMDKRDAETATEQQTAVVTVQEVKPVEELVETIVETYPVPLDEELQLFVVDECEKVSIAPEVVFAMIQRESIFRADAVGDNGQSFGLLQIQPRWHQERMDKLGVDDLLDPYQNIAVGVDYLAELVNRYEDIDMALMAFNAGPSGADKHWWSKGIYTNSYSEEVMENSEEIMKGMVVDVLYG